MNKRVVVIGGGPAGMLAAGFAALRNNEVCLIERNAYLGKKLNITGKGRCNITNNCDIQALVANTLSNGKFLYSAFSTFTPQDTMRFFEGLGVQLKTERGRRVFPVSDRARDVSDALKEFLEKNKVNIMYNSRVREIIFENDRICGVKTENETIACDAVVIATGGVSYPVTGSSGDGYALAESLGHTIIETAGSLVSLTAETETCKALQGLSLKNVKLKVFTDKNKEIFEESGEMLFTHFGLSGPLILSASAHMRNFQKYKYHVIIDLKPALDEKKLDLRLLREFDKNKNRDVYNVLSLLVPAKLVPVIARRAEIPHGLKVNSFSQTARAKLIKALKEFRIDVEGKRSVSEAVVTSGGVSVKQVNPKTMESKLVSGLYFAGEVLDADAYTGGYNLQIAWSTGYAAGNAI